MLLLLTAFVVLTFSVSGLQPQGAFYTTGFLAPLQR